MTWFQLPSTEWIMQRDLTIINPPEEKRVAFHYPSNFMNLSHHASVTSGSFVTVNLSVFFLYSWWRTMIIIVCFGTSFILLCPMCFVWKPVSICFIPWRNSLPLYCIVLALASVHYTSLFSVCVSKSVDESGKVVGNANWGDKSRFSKVKSFKIKSKLWTPYR